MLLPSVVDQSGSGSSISGDPDLDTDPGFWWPKIFKNSEHLLYL